MKAISACLGLIISFAEAAPPVISNIRVSQRPGTKLVDVYYDLADADGDSQLIQVAASSDAGLTYTIPCVTLSGSVGANVALGSNRHIVWNAGIDWSGNWVPQCRLRVTAHDGTTPSAPPGMAYIPGGLFQMGDNFNELGSETRPVHNVEVAAFFIDKTEVAWELWEQVKSWGNNNGYSIGGGASKAPAHPVHSVSWNEAVKWCNARSEMEGLAPCYFTNNDRTEIFRGGSLNIGNDMVKWNVNGYRLATEAEWEKASRGGRTGQRYPWGNGISVDEANYYTSGNLWHVGPQPFTSIVGSYPANDFGLFDMAGNLWEWCWDWYSSSYYGTPQGSDNPLGPDSSQVSGRVLRGDSWHPDISAGCRQAYRSAQQTSAASSHYGFRTVRR